MVGRVENNQHSQTALTAAAARAAHLIVDDEPHIFTDTRAGRLLGDAAETLIAYHRLHGDHIVLSGARTQVVVRSRFAETVLAEAGERGVAQYVILGAGLDSYAYRHDTASEIPRVFEVDYPASQAFKRAQLATGGIKEPDHVTFTPVDFEHDDLLARLADHGFDVDAPAVVSWLGVSMYLSRAAIGKTLRRLGALAPTSEVVFDYMLPPELRDQDGLAYTEAVAAHSAERGEPWLSFFGPDEMAALVAECGFARSRQLGQRDAMPAELWDRSDSIKPTVLSMLAHAIS